MRKQLTEEKEEIERQIKEKRENHTTRINLPSCNATRGSSLTPANAVANKSCLYSKVGVPKFKPYDHTTFKSNPRVESVMISAIKRYERSLEKAKETAAISEHNVKENVKNLHRMLDLEATKRKLDELNTKRFLELQMEEKVTATTNT